MKLTPFMSRSGDCELAFQTSSHFSKIVIYFETDFLLLPSLYGTIWCHLAIQADENRNNGVKDTTTLKYFATFEIGIALVPFASFHQ